MAEMVRDCMFLLSTYNRSKPEKVMITRCNMHFGEIEDYGKYPAILAFQIRPQYIVTALSRP
jgi:hypothetical protein